MTERNNLRSKPKAYLAGPLFSSAELMFNKYLKDKLSNFFDVYLPQEDGCLLIELVSQGMPVDLATKEIFSKDLDAIRECEVFIIILDGRAIDEGAAFELGFAFSLGKNCIGVQTDVRRLLSIGNNPMISCAISYSFSKIDDLISWASRYSKSDLF